MNPCRASSLSTSVYSSSNWSITSTTAPLHDASASCTAVVGSVPGVTTVCSQLSEPGIALAPSDGSSPADER